MKNYFLFCLLIIIFSCSYNFKISTNPKDAVVAVNDNIIDASKVYKSNKNKINVNIQRYGYKEINRRYKKFLPFGSTELKVNLIPENFDVEINSIDAPFEVIFNFKNLGNTPVKLNLAYGNYDLILKKEGCPDEKVILGAKKSGKYFFRKHKEDMKIKEIGIFDCGSLPKQVIFSPDDRYIYVILLGGLGYQVFDLDKLAVTDYIIPPDPKKQSGFPEGLFIKEKNVFWVSQMTTGNVYEYTFPGNKFIRTMSTEGLWSKFMAWSSRLQVAAVSNWESNDVSIIDYAKGSVIKKIKTAPSPRDLFFQAIQNFYT